MGVPPQYTPTNRFRKLILAVAVGCTICYFLFSLDTSPLRIISPKDLSPRDLETFKKHAINNTVVIVPVNTGMLHFAENMRCSLTRTDFDTSKIVYWALDKGAEETLSRQGHATYRDKTLYGVSGNENTHGSTAAYKRMMRERPQFFIDFLSTGYDLLMIDVDIVFWQSPLKMVPPRDKRRDIDIVYSTDAREYYSNHNAFRDQLRQGPLMPPICNGMFWMKSKASTISIWKDMLAIFQDTSLKSLWLQKRHFRDDQRGMDFLLNDGRAKAVAPYPEGITDDMVPNKYSKKADVHVQLLDQTEYANGQIFMFRHEEYQEKLMALQEVGKDRVAVHMNWNTREVSKADGSRNMDIFYLDENGYCKLAA